MLSKRILLLCSAVTCLILLFLAAPRLPFLKTRPAITYFPENGNITYKRANTLLQLSGRTGNLEWRVQSEINRRVYLMQDYSLLYRNNRLIAMINHWESGTHALLETRKLPYQPGYYESMTAHQAEVHQDEHIYGRIKLSGDQLYIRKISGHIESFKMPGNGEQKQAADLYQKEISREQMRIVEKAAEEYGIARSAYRIVPLSALDETSADDLFSFALPQARRITGQLWEGLYKALTAGIQTPDGQVHPSGGSSMPMLFIGADHLLVAIETSSGKMALLKQSY